jgi:hypothetical protein
MEYGETKKLAQKFSEKYRIIAYDKYGKQIGCIVPNNTQWMVDKSLIQKNRYLKW